MKSSKGRNVYFFIKGFIKLVDGLICILSFGFLWSDFEYRFTKYQMFNKK